MEIKSISDGAFKNYGRFTMHMMYLNGRTNGDITRNRGGCICSVNKNLGI